MQNDFNLLQSIKKNLELLSGAFCDVLSRRRRDSYRLIEKRLYEKIDFIVCETYKHLFKDGAKKLENITKELEKRGIKNIFLD